MENIERAVAQHYGVTDLLERIFKGLEAAGTDLNCLQPEDLAPVDEYHIGGREATAHAIDKMSLSEDQHVLDIGCGIGGTARYMAEKIGCKVTGIDLTPEYISIAKTLTDLTGLGSKVTYKVASALDMPFESKTFDAVITIHVAMNIPERATLYSEIARVMKPGATLCIYDVMKKSDESFSFPVPWAESAVTSHLTTPEEMRTLLNDAGFDVREVDDRTDFALNFFKQSLAAAADGPPPLGIHLIIGSSAPEKLKNMQSNIENGCISVVQMIADRCTNPPF
ncbi:MAG: methyltransferase domain-containing protein [Thermodesulfobacteriota bacterium]|jgi:SAM-dependent methyltransferase